MTDQFEQARIEQREEQIDFKQIQTDGCIYVLKCTRESDGEYIWYVGSTTDLDERYWEHTEQKGDFSGPSCDGRLRPKDEVEFDVSLNDVEMVSKRGAESDKEYRQRMRRREQEKQCEVAIKHDTTQVYGGR